jgi:two-component system chemotaxis response regulator CheY
MGKYVLLVEDYRPTSHMLQALLELKGYTVRPALDGLEALQQIVIEIPALILLDLKMPSMDGYAFLDALERRRGEFSVPVLVLTADSFAGPGLAHKVVKIFYKPLRFGPLLAAIEQFCHPASREETRTIFNYRTGAMLQSP